MLFFSADKRDHRLYGHAYRLKFFFFSYGQYKYLLNFAQQYLIKKFKMIVLWGEGAGIFKNAMVEIWWWF